MTDIQVYTIILGFIMAFIAFQQWRTAESRRRMDLLEKRNDLYQKVRNGLADLCWETCDLIDECYKILAEQNDLKDFYKIKRSFKVPKKDFSFNRYELNMIKALFDTKTLNVIEKALISVRSFDDIHYTKGDLAHSFLKDHKTRFIYPVLAAENFLDDYVVEKYLVVEKDWGSELYDGISHFLFGLCNIVCAPIRAVKKIYGYKKHKNLLEEMQKNEFSEYLKIKKEKSNDPNR